MNLVLALDQHLFLFFVDVELRCVRKLVWNQQVDPLLQVVVRPGNAHEYDTRLNLLMIAVEATEQQYLTF